MTKKYDALVVLGRGFGLESKMNALAAGDLFNRRLTDRLIFSGGQTMGEEYPSEAEEMVSYMKRTYPNIPSDCIIVEGKAIDTPDNAEKVRKIIGEYGFDKLGLLTIKVHVPRAIEIFGTYGMNVDGFASEDILAQKSNRHAKLVSRYSASLHEQKMKVLEAVLMGISVFDPYGKMLRQITKRIRR